MRGDDGWMNGGWMGGCLAVVARASANVVSPSDPVAKAAEGDGDGAMLHLSILHRDETTSRYPSIHLLDDFRL